MNSVLRFHFWPLQIIGWTSYLLVNFLTAVAHGKSADYFEVSLTVSVGGFLLTLPLHPMLKRIWHWPAGRLFSALVPAFLLVTVAMGMISAYAVQFYCPTECVPRNVYGYLAYSGSMAMVILSWIGLWFGIRLQRAYSEERQRVLTAQHLAHEAHLKMLRYQLNPHFLFNTLNAISTLVLDRANDTAERMLGALSRFLRYTLEQEPQQKVPLQREMEILNLYLGIEKMRFPDRLQLDLRVDPALDQALVPSLILQPLVENAIKHAVARSERSCTLQIHASSRADRLLLSVADDGPGCDPGAVQQGCGVGLRNTRERLQTLYGDAQHLRLVERPEGGVLVEIELPLQWAGAR